jgi:hypothetical protein
MGSVHSLQSTDGGGGGGGSSESGRLQPWVESRAGVGAGTGEAEVAGEGVGACLERRMRSLEEQNSKLQEQNVRLEGQNAMVLEVLGRMEKHLLPPDKPEVTRLFGASVISGPPIGALG